ncbi:TetR/AcrR family transcriptional regulator [Pontibacter fetidus]|uniref:TetR/AcrR family transcriptional regulator n=1 Tax=Pontibacter fetidus TaxID=2700082 RepID=A0A6B2H5I2_9BACT|nr:TetR/AcrR family transcriptional regulator [Pontibacter fetidus]NDK54372.1 TetR/AcrR family transcriptional regulator [Pontibacter fetidus]
MNRFEEKREQTINKLLTVALRLFALQGFEATSIRTIAADAGISLGLLYNYFKSKDELLDEIFKRGINDIKVTLQETHDSTGSGIEQHIRQTVKLLKEKKEFWKLLHSIRMQSVVVRQLMAEQTTFVEAHIKQDLVEAGIPFPDLEAKLLFASVDGMAHHYLLHDNYPIDDVATLLIMKYKRG